MSILCALVHVLGIACFGVAIFYNTFLIRLSEEEKVFPWRWLYLTIWDIVIQFIYHTVGLLNDIFGSNNIISGSLERPFLQRFRDYLFISLAFPIGTFVTATFWGLVALDPSLVFDVEKEQVSEWINHIEHTGPGVILLLELLIVPKLPPRHLIGICTNVTFCVSYLIWINWIHSLNGTWAYPMLRKWDSAERFAFLGASCLIIIVFYGVGVLLTGLRLVWKPKPRSGADIGLLVV
ncbi:unnamed protein product [Orchesella dallaii]|uniref:FAR-17a/AIG1-like protein n=1 Tax=Orchesella dallaii TaxID=48710 RepID=A0ABP1RQC0_9HEXA